MLEPLNRDQEAIVYPNGKEKAALADVADIAILARVSEEVDETIREQIKAGGCPVQVCQSGEIRKKTIKLRKTCAFPRAMYCRCREQSEQPPKSSVVELFCFAGIAFI